MVCSLDISEYRIPSLVKATWPTIRLCILLVIWGLVAALNSRKHYHVLVQGSGNHIYIYRYLLLILKRLKRYVYYSLDPSFYFKDHYACFLSPCKLLEFDSFPSFQELTWPHLKHGTIISIILCFSSHTDTNFFFHVDNT